ncbi:UBA/TS-N domain-containing protein [Cordyceps javanica]|uniref:UBA/TS-N domain-containing protein n=1 Tax=Cordyceps javanica TaxID=43265 RepID=A0A545VZN2_9HYPO|nr:UBA/TS-N domain-containing protein [Cordyceps javanica]TQW07180.1 UBA/TS-N domain protein [Cordyceps javanica]
MDDLSGLDWSKPGGGQPPKAAPMASNMAYPSLRPSPSPFGSGRSTPASTQGTGGSSFAKPTQPLPQQQQQQQQEQLKAAQDSFSSLARFGPAKTSQTLSLAERQAQLEADKRRKEEEKRKLTEAQFGSGQQWDMLGARGQTSSPSLQPPALGTRSSSQDDDDLFAAFNKDTKVDNASHFPPPDKKAATAPSEKKPLDLTNPNAWSASGSDPSAFPDNDDDPFGLSEFKSNGAPGSSVPQSRTQIINNDDDDFLGDLGRPVEEVRAKQQAAPQRGEPGKPIEDDESSSSDEEELPQRRRNDTRRAHSGGDTEFDSAVAQLVDYGFAPEDARRALVESGAGTNVQQAANWLLDEAHRKSKAKAQGRPASDNSNRADRQEQTHTGRSDPDFAKSAAAVGSSLFKTANSLWKTGQKKVQRAVADFQQEGGGDPSQPKWMRDAQANQARGPSRQEASATDEAMMLESGGRPRQAKEKGHRPTPDPARSSSPVTSSASQSRSGSVPRWQQQQAAPAPLVPNARSRLNRFADDDDTFAISSSRRRKPASPAEPAKTEPEPDLLFGSEASRQPSRPTPPPPQAAPVAKKPQSNPTPVRKATPKTARQIPPITPSAVQNSTKHRLEGTAHFKRGDFAQAHASYSASLAAVPSAHPLAIVLLTNRALTALKTGEPKQAVTDADQAMAIIGPGNGQGETVAVTGDDGQEEKRDMRDLYGKALSRKAEALEQMEKWGDALTVWKLAVEAGLGGATAAKGRQRCQTALAPKPKAAPKPAAAVPKPRPPASAAASLQPQKDSAAVTRLREANEAAAKEDDEKFALSETVDAKIGAWRDGKRDNLRGLIASLDQVLWEGSGWKKVGMHELVMANKVKISYMKAIAKTHPDKIAQDASTEVRLIAGLVFSTLNEAWDKFKAENGL